LIFTEWAKKEEPNIKNSCPTLQKTHRRLVQNSTEAVTMCIETVGNKDRLIKY